MADSSLPTVLTAILGGGGAAFVVSWAKAWTAVRGGAKARERETINDIEKRADDAVAREQVAQLNADYWRGIAGRYHWQLVSKGVNPDPQDPVQPSDRPPPAAPGHR